MYKRYNSRAESILTLPVYYTHKAKKGTETILVGINKYERMHYQPRNKLKKHYYDIIKSKLNSKPLQGKIKTHYTYYYKNILSDAPNIIAIIDKLFMDQLQNSGVIKNDNVTNYIGSSWEVGGQDKKNPRVEVRVIEVT